MQSDYHEEFCVADAMGWGQSACQEEWKICKKKRGIVMLM
jgi:hypothetical protein